jgi:hypothetical protein
MYHIMDVDGVSTMMDKEEYKELMIESSVISIQKVLTNEDINMRIIENK